MTDGIISRRILKAIDESTKDPEIQGLLQELLYEEAEHSGQWRWKEPFRNKVNEYLSRRKSSE
jgi:hypothetical protein